MRSGHLNFAYHGLHLPGAIQGLPARDIGLGLAGGATALAARGSVPDPVSRRPNGAALFLLPASSSDGVEKLMRLASAENPVPGLESERGRPQGRRALTPAVVIRF
jgi:hypothetical protein